MHITLNLNKSKTKESKKIEMIKNIISIKKILENFGITKIELGEQIWIKRLNFETFRKEPYTMRSKLDWETFNGCEVAISPERPVTDKENETSEPQNKPSEKICSVGSGARKKQAEEMFIMNIVIKNQNK